MILVDMLKPIFITTMLVEAIMPLQTSMHASVHDILCYSLKLHAAKQFKSRFKIYFSFSRAMPYATVLYPGVAQWPCSSTLTLQENKATMGDSEYVGYIICNQL